MRGLAFPLAQLATLRQRAGLALVEGGGMCLNAARPRNAHLGSVCARVRRYCISRCYAAPELHPPSCVKNGGRARLQYVLRGPHHQKHT